MDRGLEWFGIGLGLGLVSDLGFRLGLGFGSVLGSQNARATQIPIRPVSGEQAGFFGLGAAIA